ncbi:MAG: FHIPEP family type III secretion protein [Treponema sp.]|nr:FHIPEP family type III secretion protein [Treponema sp.]
MANRFNLKNVLNDVQNHAIAAAAILVILMLLLPVPGVFLDVLMIGNIALSVIILLVVLYTPKASSFTSFPRILLFATLYGLSINVSSTRLILTEASRTGYDNFSGNMLKAFSSVVTGDASGKDTTGLVIGMVIFIILIIIQVIVITKGATRVSEVAARFSLDSMSQKFFAVDSELAAGYITDEEARARKQAIQRDIDFYSAMDGASKFVSGNVKAGIFITVVDLLAGIITGVAIGHLPFSGAAGLYSRLTIGDGLLGQLPSLLLSFATGLIVTGTSAEENLGDQVKEQFAKSGYVYVIAGVTLALMSLIPGFPWYLLVPIGAMLVFLGFRMLRQEKATFARKLKEAEESKKGKQTGEDPSKMGALAKLDELSLEVGSALIPLVDEQKGAELLERVRRIRREIAVDLGVVVPAIRIVDNMQLNPEEYSFKIRGIEAGRGRVKVGYYMCMNIGSVSEEIRGEPTKDPTFGLPAVWVNEEQRGDAERAGYAVVDAPTIVATHLTEILSTHAYEILDRERVSAILKEVRETNPVVVDEVLNTYKYTYGEIEKVLQGLLRERVSIRNIVTILETLANYGMYTPRDTNMLIKAVRESLGHQICLQYVDEDKKLSVLMLSQSSAEKILQNTSFSQDGTPVVAFSPVEQRAWINNVSNAITALQEKNFLPIILCPGQVRQAVRCSIEREMPKTVVLSIEEVAAAGKDVNLEILGEIDG